MRTPKYRRQSRRGTGHDRAFVQLDGKRVYLGVYDSAESHERYHRILADVASGASQTPETIAQAINPSTDQPSWTLAELID